MVVEEEMVSVSSASDDVACHQAVTCFVILVRGSGWGEAIAHCFSKKATHAEHGTVTMLSAATHQCVDELML